MIYFFGKKIENTPCLTIEESPYPTIVDTPYEMIRFFQKKIRNRHCRPIPFFREKIEKDVEQPTSNNSATWENLGAAWYFPAASETVLSVMPYMMRLWSLLAWAMRVKLWISTQDIQIDVIHISFFTLTKTYLGTTGVFFSPIMRDRLGTSKYDNAISA